MTRSRPVKEYLEKYPIPEETDHGTPQSNPVVVSGHRIVPSGWKKSNYHYIFDWELAIVKDRLVEWAHVSCSSKHKPGGKGCNRNCTLGAMNVSFSCVCVRNWAGYTKLMPNIRKITPGYWNPRRQ